MKQFRRTTVVNLLKSYNADTDVARKAADVVYETARTRNERRTLRQFLKERETVFSEQFRSDTLPQTSNTIFERNLNLFKEYGLTGKDMAEILIHTPSLAFKKDLSTVPRILHTLLIDTLGLRKYEGQTAGFHPQRIGCRSEDVEIELKDRVVEIIDCELAEGVYGRP